MKRTNFEWSPSRSLWSLMGGRWWKKPGPTSERLRSLVALLRESWLACLKWRQLLKPARANAMWHSTSTTINTAIYGEEEDNKKPSTEHNTWITGVCSFVQRREDKTSAEANHMKARFGASFLKQRSTYLFVWTQQGALTKRIEKASQPNIDKRNTPRRRK